MKVDLCALTPPPTKMVANLPYSVATPLLLRTIAELPSDAGWSWSSGRSPTGSARRAGRNTAPSSVQVQLACEVTMLRAVDPAVFVPRPRVGSALLGCGGGGRRAVRGSPRSSGRLRAPAQVTRAVAGAVAARQRCEPARRALEEMGKPADARAETLSPEEFERLVGGAEREVVRREPASRTVLAPAKLNLCLYVGPRRDDGLHEICSLFEPLELADELVISRRGRGPGDLRGHRGARPDRHGTRGAARARLGGAAAADRGHEARSGRGRPRRRQRRRGGGVAAGVGEIEGLRAIAAGIGAECPSQLQPRACLVAGAGEVIEPAAQPADHGIVLIPSRRGCRRRRSTPRPTARHAAGEAELEAIRRRLREAIDEGGSPLDYRAQLVNDLQPAAISLRPEIGVRWRRWRRQARRTRW